MFSLYVVTQTLASSSSSIAPTNPQCYKVIEPERRRHGTSEKKKMPQKYDDENSEKPTEKRRQTTERRDGTAVNLQRREVARKEEGIIIIENLFTSEAIRDSVIVYYYRRYMHAQNYHRHIIIEGLTYLSRLNWRDDFVSFCIFHIHERTDTFL